MDLEGMGWNPHGEWQLRRRNRPGEKCADCHGTTEDGKKLTCTQPKLCKGKDKK